MSDRLVVPTAAGAAHLVFTDRTDGDLGGDLGGHADPAGAARAVIDLPWTWLEQVHGDEVLIVDTPGQGCGTRADALVTAQPGAVLAVRGADCPLVAFVGDDGVVGVAHAGWRGLAAGVLQQTVSAMRTLGAGDLRAWLGPCIGPARYEFGTAELDALAERLGPRVRARTDWGTPALDLVAGVDAVLAACDVPLDTDRYRCTAADPGLFSHRARGDRGRHAVVVWLEAP